MDQPARRLSATTAPAAVFGDRSLFQVLVEEAADAIFVRDRDGRYLFVNQAAAARLGLPPAAVVGRTVDELFPAQLAVELKAAGVHVIDTGETLATEHRIDGDGEPKWIATILQPLRDATGRIVAAHGVVRVITGLKDAERALRDSEQRLRLAVGVAHIGIFEHNHLDDSIYLSPELLETLGFDDTPDDLRHTSASAMLARMLAGVHPDDRARVETAIARSHNPGGDGKHEVEHRHVRPDGVVRVVTVSSQTFFEGTGTASRPVRTVGAVRDITEWRHAEAAKDALEGQLVQAQKMESIGRLAGGVAHDFNNMLNVILGWSDVALGELDAVHPAHEALREIRRAAQRSADLTGQLLAFARRQPIAPRVLNLNVEIASALKMLERLVGEGIEVTWRPAERLWPVRIDPGQVGQILTNLVANARDAMPGGVGHVTITTANVSARAGDAARPHMAGECVSIIVADDGAGMDEETQRHMFEPFYTTKARGRGTGLGLATVYGIVKQNHGWIDVRSAPGTGTTVTILLRRDEADVEAVRDDGPLQAPARGHETVLLVEDELMVLALTRRILEKEGYTVLSVQSPDDAVAAAARHDGPIHLLVTDVELPQMSGPELAEHLAARRPALKRLFISGRQGSAIARDGVAFLQKPFTPAAIAAKVRSVLDEA